MALLLYFFSQQRRVWIDTYECCDRLAMQFYETWKALINSADFTEKLYNIDSQQRQTKRKKKKHKPIQSKPENLQHIECEWASELDGHGFESQFHSLLAR